MTLKYLWGQEKKQQLQHPLQLPLTKQLTTKGLQKKSSKMNDNIYRVKALSNPLVYACITGLASLALRSTPEPAKPVPPCRRAKTDIIH